MVLKHMAGAGQHHDGHRTSKNTLGMKKHEAGKLAKDEVFPAGSEVQKDLLRDDGLMKITGTQVKYRYLPLEHHKIFLYGIIVMQK